MKTNFDIEKLLEKYYNGDTTLAEEQWLKQHILNNENSVEKLIFSDIIEQNNTIKPKTNKGFTKNATRKYIALASSIIAAACLLFFLWNVNYNTPINNRTKSSITNQILVDNNIKGSINDPELALQQAEKALAFVNSKLNTGMQNIEHLNKLNQPKNQDYEN